MLFFFSLRNSYKDFVRQGALAITLSNSAPQKETKVFIATSPPSLEARLRAGALWARENPFSPLSPLQIEAAHKLKTTSCEISAMTLYLLLKTTPSLFAPLFNN